jgi:hypothetical protein
MSESFRKYRATAIAILLLLFVEACIGSRFGNRITASSPTEAPVTTSPDILPAETLTLPPELPTATATEVPATATATPQSEVSITAVDGNLFIRRGPDMAFNPIGVLYKKDRAEAIGRDVLSKWVQVVIPNSDKKGWISLQTKYSQVDGDISSLPEVEPTDWPIPAYLRNCTYHQMYVLPNEITIPSSLFAPENEIWIYPGTYRILDLDAPDQPEVMEVDIREGSDVEITMNGLGEKRICP